MQSNNTYLNILASFAYLGKAKGFCDSFFSASKEGRVNAMIDSGAFTLFNAKKGKLSWLNLDNYCKFLEQYGNYSEKYVMLDVINQHEQSKDNYETMIKRGFNPMFVFTSLDNDYEYLKHAVSNNKHICVAGGVTTKSDWMKKRYQDVYKNTEANIHGLGFVKFPDMYQLPLHSVDSSSWAAGEMYGVMTYFTHLGVKAISYKDVLLRKKKLPIELMNKLDEYKITPKVFSDLEQHRISRNIRRFSSIVTFLEYQKYSKKQGLNLFLAVASKEQFEDILYIDEEMNKGRLTYEKYKNRSNS